MLNFYQIYLLHIHSNNYLNMYYKFYQYMKIHYLIVFV